jgi:hypothetical protein
MSETGEVKSLDEMTVLSGVSREDDGTFRPFAQIRVVADDGTTFKGILTPEELRTTALHFLKMAETAEQDCLVITMLTRELGLNPEVAAGFVSAVRDERDKIGGVQNDGDGDGPGLPSWEPAEAEDPGVP